MRHAFPQQHPDQQLVHTVSQAAATLSPDDQDFLCQRYGLLDGIRHSLEATAERFQLTISETARRESRILRLLRSPLREAHLQLPLCSSRHSEGNDSWQGRFTL